jgi:hypothetical protein
MDLTILRYPNVIFGNECLAYVAATFLEGHLHTTAVQFFCLFLMALDRCTKLCRKVGARRRQIALSLYSDQIRSDSMFTTKLMR